MSEAPDQVLDASGMACPMPIIKTNKVMKSMQPGQVLELIATDPGAPSDVKAWTSRTGNALLDSTHEGDKYIFHIRKAG